MPPSDKSQARLHGLNTRLYRWTKGSENSAKLINWVRVCQERGSLILLLVTEPSKKPKDED